MEKEKGRRRKERKNRRNCITLGLCRLDRLEVVQHGVGLYAYISSDAFGAIIGNEFERGIIEMDFIRHKPVPDLGLLRMSACCADWNSRSRGPIFRHGSTFANESSHVGQAERASSGKDGHLPRVQYVHPRPRTRTNRAQFPMGGRKTDMTKSMYDYWNRDEMAEGYRSATVSYLILGKARPLRGRWS